MKHSYLWALTTGIWGGYHSFTDSTIEHWLLFMFSGFIWFLYYNNMQLKDSWKA